MLSVLAQIGLKSQLQGTPSVVNHGKELHPNVHSLFSTKNIKEIEKSAQRYIPDETDIVD